MSLGRQMQAGLTSPQSGFSTFIIFSVSATPTNRQMLNIFNANALNSGVIARIFSIQIKQNGFGYCIANLSVRTDGVDNNLGSNAAVITHNIGGPGSNMHVSFANNTIIPVQNTFVGIALLDNDLYDFAGSRGAYYLNPGQNLTMDVQDALPSSRIFMVFDWTDK